MQRTSTARVSEALVSSAPQEVPANLGAVPPDVPDDGRKEDFIVEIATHLADDPEFCILWSALVAQSKSHQKIYQTPEFFQFQRQTCDNGERLEVLAIYRRSNRSLAGVLPVRLGRQELVFGIGKFVFGKARVETINLLGSVPAAPGGAMLTQHFCMEVLAAFPQAKAIFMQSLSAQSEHWQNLEAPATCPRPLESALMGPWRDCHTLPLPATFEQYLEKFSAKKRYNLNRQVRQLSEQAGTLVMQRVTRQDEVAPMMAALMALVPPELQSGILRPSTFEALARRNLLLCFILRAGDNIAGAVIGTRSPDVLHVHNIYVNKKYLALSVGTTVMHLAIKDLMADRCFEVIDFGFGTPNHDFRSSHVLETRAQVLLFDRSRPVRLLFRAHAHFNAVAELAIAKVKAWRKARQDARRQKPV